MAAKVNLVSSNCSFEYAVWQSMAERFVILSEAVTEQAKVTAQSKSLP